jgi:hypothetical protein
MTIPGDRRTGVLIDRVERCAIVHRLVNSTHRKVWRRGVARQRVAEAEHALRVAHHGIQVMRPLPSAFAGVF